MKKCFDKHVYIFSGLGADDRVFQKMDLSAFSTQFVSWIKPIGNEAIEAYASRISKQIESAAPILIGLSFGGIIAIEVAKQINTSKVILLASVKTKTDIPFYYRVAGRIRLHKLLPIKFVKRTNFITNWLFGAKNAADRQILKEVMRDTDPDFLKWAIDKLVRWNNKERLPNIFHIHGTRDRLFPEMFLQADYNVEGGGHLMTLTDAHKVDLIVRRQISRGQNCT